ncbi:MAG: DUF1697 domain-containing protein [Gemmataceae bacterium]
MSTHVALLRGINVGGRNMVAMSDLRGLFKRLGFTDVQSLLQSGNLVFQSDRTAEISLENLLSVETKKLLNVSIDYFVRSREEWDTVVAVNPFPKEAKLDPGHLVVMFLKDAAKATDVKALQSAIQGPETLCCVGKQVYIYYPAGMGKSKLTHSLIEKKLGTRGTGRNWNTVLKLAALTQK